MKFLKQKKNICNFKQYRYIYIHRHTWMRTFKNMQKLVNSNKNMLKLMSDIYYIYTYI